MQINDIEHINNFYQAGIEIIKNGNKQNPSQYDNNGPSCNTLCFVESLLYAYIKKNEHNTIETILFLLVMLINMLNWKIIVRKERLVMPHFS